MPSGFHALLAAQLVSGLADNALLIVTIARLGESAEPAWWAPALKLGFTLAYVLLAPWVGALADTWPKSRVMFASNALKAIGCVLLTAGVSPLLAFTLVGIGAAVYSPAKYGLVTELVPPARLVAANGWLEVCTVGSALLGTVLGGLLVGPWASMPLPVQLPLADTGTRLLPALAGVLALYLLAALFNLGVPDSGARYAPSAGLRGGPLVSQGRVLGLRFQIDNRRLWSDPEARVSLAVTTLFWGAGAALQFAVLRWGQESLGLGLHEAAMLQAAVAVGVVGGAAAAGRFMLLRRAVAVLPLGVAMGMLVPLLTVVDQLSTAVPLLVAVGACAGFFVVPMNALLQHRGHQLLSAGRSIAVQNFSENLGVLAMLALYAALTAAQVALPALIGSLGVFVAVTTAWIARIHHRRPPAAAPASTTPENA